VLGHDAHDASPGSVFKSCSLDDQGQHIYNSPQKPHRTMSWPNQQQQIYQIPDQPSPQLKAVLEYFDCLKTWDFEKVTKLSTPYFTQKTLPASMNVPTRNKSEDIKNLHDLQGLLKGGPLEVCDRGPLPPRSNWQ
jgi:hypothetical protein